MRWEWVQMVLDLGCSSWTTTSRSTDKAIGKLCVGITPSGSMILMWIPREERWFNGVHKWCRLHYYWLKLSWVLWTTHQLFHILSFRWTPFLALLPFKAYYRFFHSVASKKALKTLLQTIAERLQVIKHLKALHLTYLLAIKHTLTQMHYLRQTFEIWMNVWIFSFKYSW